MTIAILILLVGYAIFNEIQTRKINRAANDFMQIALKHFDDIKVVADTQNKHLVSAFENFAKIQNTFEQTGQYLNDLNDKYMTVNGNFLKILRTNVLLLRFKLHYEKENPRLYLRSCERVYNLRFDNVFERLNKLEQK